MGVFEALILAAVVLVAHGSPCYDSDVSKVECEALGCRWNNRCTEPKFCKKLQRGKPFRYLHPQGHPDGQTIKEFTVIRPPLTTEQANLCAPENNPECTAIYEVTVHSKYTTGPPNCNDLGMLPPHGRDQRVCADPNANGLSPVESAYWENSNQKRYLMDLSNDPFPDDAIKQSVAKGANAHPALMEETANCFEIDSDWEGITDDGDRGQRNKPRPEGGLNRQCAFPLGFASDAILKSKAVCVVVKGTEGRWVEIMAASSSGSNGGSFCVSDWGPEGNEQACTKEGDLYECREAGRSQSGLGEHEMRLKFQAFDNIDDAHIEMYWRITASKLPEGTTGEEGEEKDAEDWCQFRDAADFPLSLMGAYPKNFNGNPVFDVRPSSGSRLAPAAALIAAATLVAVVW